MNPSVFLFSSSSDSEDEHKVALIRKNIRDKSSPLALSEVEFKRRFRLSKDAFKYVLENIHFSGHISTSVPQILQLAATLNLLASGSFQHNAGNDFLLGLAQSTMCKVIKNVTIEIQKKLCPIMIQFILEVYMSHL
ncbi:uncharacterized protein LOC142233262 [Haematobia irritans]|uniref:uncharacterized protein LOC142233262 n=1 Tax=Haematobia irritans TaxID=7368 RepID=UPI003F507686